MSGLGGWIQNLNARRSKKKRGKFQDTLLFINIALKRRHGSNGQEFIFNQAEKASTGAGCPPPHLREQ